MIAVLGIGLRENAALSAFHEIAKRLGAPSGCPVALPAFRAGLPLPQALQAAGHRLVLIPAKDLWGVKTPSQSPRSLAHYGTGSLAEACALLACSLVDPSPVGSGPARLLAAAMTSSDRTITAALAARDFQPERPLP